MRSFAGFEVVGALPGAPAGLQRWSARDAEGRSAEVLVGASLAGRAAGLPTDAPFVEVRHGAEGAASWVVVPDPVQLSLPRLRGQLSPAAVFSLGELLLEALTPLHAAGRHHGRLHPGGIGFASDGRLWIRPLMLDTALAGPVGEAPSAAGDCYAIGAILRYLLGDAWPPRPTARVNLAGVDTTRAQLLLDGLLWTRARWRLSPARSALQTLRAVLRDVPDADAELAAVLAAMGVAAPDHLPVPLPERPAFEPPRRATAPTRLAPRVPATPLTVLEALDELGGDAIAFQSEPVIEDDPDLTSGVREPLSWPELPAPPSSAEGAKSWTTPEPTAVPMQVVEAPVPIPAPEPVEDEPSFVDDLDDPFSDLDEPLDELLEEEPADPESVVDDQSWHVPDPLEVTGEALVADLMGDELDDELEEEEQEPLEEEPEPEPVEEEPEHVEDEPEPVDDEPEPEPIEVEPEPEPVEEEPEPLEDEPEPDAEEPEPVEDEPDPEPVEDEPEPEPLDDAPATPESTAQALEAALAPPADPEPIAKAGLWATLTAPLRSLFGGGASADEPEDEDEHTPQATAGVDEELPPEPTEELPAEDEIDEEPPPVDQLDEPEPDEDPALDTTTPVVVAFEQDEVAPTEAEQPEPEEPEQPEPDLEPEEPEPEEPELPTAEPDEPDLPSGELVAELSGTLPPDPWALDFGPEHDEPPEELPAEPALDEPAPIEPPDEDDELPTAEPEDEELETLAPARDPLEPPPPLVHDPFALDAPAPELSKPVAPTPKPTGSDTGSILDRKVGDMPAWSLEGAPSVTANHDREQELGAGKWTETGRSLEEIAKELPSTPTRELSIEGGGPPWGAILGGIAVLSALAFFMMRGEPEPETVPPPVEAPSANLQVGEVRTVAADAGGPSVVVRSVPETASVTLDGFDYGLGPVAIPVPTDGGVHELCLVDGERRDCRQVTGEQLAATDPYTYEASWP